MSRILFQSWPFVILVELWLAAFAYSQSPGGDGEGGGGSQPQMSVSVSSDKNPILIGHTSVLTATVTGGTSPYTYGWAEFCTNQNPPPNPIPFAQGEQTKNWCAPKVGAIKVYCQAVDAASLTAVNHIVMNVLAPNKLKIESGVIQTDLGQGSATWDAEHTFKLCRDDEPVGGCLVACASERVWSITANEPQTWQYTGCDPQTSPQFYFVSPLVHDTRHFIIPGNWSQTPNNTIVDEKFQRVKVDVPACDGTIAIETTRLRFTIKKIDADTVEFKVVEDP